MTAPWRRRPDDDELDQTAIDADPAGFAQWQEGRAAYESAGGGPVPILRDAAGPRPSMDPGTNGTNAWSSGMQQRSGRSSGAQTWSTPWGRPAATPSPYEGRGRRSAPTQPAAPPPTYSSGMYDPNRAGTQFNASGDADLGANNGFNMANIWNGWQEQLGAGRDRVAQQEGYASGSRAAWQAYQDAPPPAYAGYQPPAPVYGGAPQMPGQYQAPAWQAPDPSGWQQPRPGLSSDSDLTTSITALGGTNGPGMQAEGPTVGGFGGAYREAAQGLMGQFQRQLGTQLRTNVDNAAGRGRLNTGFYDEDVGRLATDLSAQANDQLAATALQGATLDQQAALASGGWQYGASVTNANNAAQRNQYLTSIAAARAGQQDTLRQQGYSDDRNFAYGTGRDLRGDFEGDRAFGADQQRTNYAQAADQRGFEYGTYRDARSDWSGDRSFDYGVSRDARGDYNTDRAAAGGMYQFDQGQAVGAQNQYLDQLASTRDWRMQAGAAEQAQKGGFLKSVLPALGTVAGFALGGPAGAAIGGSVGNSLGGGGYQAPQFGGMPRTATQPDAGYPAVQPPIQGDFPSAAPEDLAWWNRQPAAQQPWWQQQPAYG